VCTLQACHHACLLLLLLLLLLQHGAKVHVASAHGVVQAASTNSSTTHVASCCTCARVSTHTTLLLLLLQEGHVGWCQEWQAIGQCLALPACACHAVLAWLAACCCCCCCCCTIVATAGTTSCCRSGCNRLHARHRLRLVHLLLLLLHLCHERLLLQLLRPCGIAEVICQETLEHAHLLLLLLLLGQATGSCTLLLLLLLLLCWQGQASMAPTQLLAWCGCTATTCSI
jgi:hypothetical protein